MYGTEAGIFFSEIYYACDLGDGIDLFYQPIYHPSGDRMEGGTECSFIFDKRNTWHSGCLSPLWHFNISKFVNIAQNFSNLKFTLDK